MVGVVEVDKYRIWAEESAQLSIGLVELY